MNMAFFKKVAPWMASAVASTVPGPIGMVAGMISNIIKKDVKPDGDSINAAIAGATPDQLIQIKLADNDFAEKMQQMGFTHEEQLEEMGVADRASAREMQTNTRSWVPAALSVIFVSGFLLLLCGMMFGKFKPEDNQALILMLGCLTVGVGQVLNFWFGSSASSDRKTELLAQAPPVKR